MAPIAGKLVDYCGRRVLLLVCSVMFTLCIFLLTLADNILVFCFFFCLQSIPRGIGPVILAMYVPENLPTLDRGKNALMYTMGFPLGLAISSGTAYLILEDFQTGD